MIVSSHFRHGEIDPPPHKIQQAISNHRPVSHGDFTRQQDPARRKIIQTRHFVRLIEKSGDERALHLKKITDAKKYGWIHIDPKAYSQLQPFLELPARFPVA